MSAMSDVRRTMRMAREEGRAIGIRLEGLTTVPGWSVRFAAGAAAALLLLVAGFAGAGGVAAAIAGVLVVLVVVRPADGWAGAALVLVGVRLVTGAVPGAGTVAALVAAAHLVVLLSGLAARAPLACHVEVAVLAGLLRGAWRVQLGAQALALAVRLAVGDAAPATGAWWRLLALAAAVGLVATVVPPRRRP